MNFLSSQIGPERGEVAVNSWWRALVGMMVGFCALGVSGCDSEADDCPVNPDDPTKYVIVGFWKTTDCSGDPETTNAFPVEGNAPCYCWPGNSGENSADTFSCDPDTNSFTYVQYGSLTCGQDDNTPTSKTVYTDRCEQDIPPTLYARIVDYGACTP